MCSRSTFYMSNKMKSVIDKFINGKNIAVIGVSRNKEKWGSMLYNEFKKKGYTVSPVNPNMDTYNEVRCYASITELPPQVENAVFAIPRDATEEVIQQAPQSNIKRVWLHKGGGASSDSEEAISFCKNNNIPVVRRYAEGL